MNISKIKRGIAAVAAKVDGLNTYGFCPDAVEVPCLYTGEVEVAYHETYGGDARLMVTCYVLTSSSEDEAGQDLLDQLLSIGTSSSVVDAIEGTPGNPQDLGGQCDDLVIMSASGYRKYQVGDAWYFGAKLPVQVIGVRSEG